MKREKPKQKPVASPLNAISNQPGNRALSPRHGREGAVLLRKKEYLARAEEADRHAEKMSDLSMREAWKRIANDDRALAATVDKPPPVIF